MDRYTSEIRELKKVKEMHRLGLNVELPKGHTSIESIEERLAHLKEKFHTHDACIGGAGLEKQWDERLRGAPGKMLTHVDATGEPTSESKLIRAPKAGEPIQVSLSIELQKSAKSSLLTMREGAEG